jgi:hypothetical protein
MELFLSTEGYRTLWKRVHFQNMQRFLRLISSTTYVAPFGLFAQPSSFHTCNVLLPYLGYLKMTKNEVL